MALLEKAAGQGHAYAMDMLANIYRELKEHVLAAKWFTKGAEAGLPRAMFGLGCCLDSGEGVAAPDYPAAAGWYRRAADAGDGDAAHNLCTMYMAGRGARQIMIMPATSTPHSSPSFLESNGIHLQCGEHYLPGPRARRQA